MAEKPEIGMVKTRETEFRFTEHAVPALMRGDARSVRFEAVNGGGTKVTLLREGTKANVRNGIYGYSSQLSKPVAAVACRQNGMSDCGGPVNGSVKAGSLEVSVPNKVLFGRKSLMVTQGVDGVEVGIHEDDIKRGAFKSENGTQVDGIIRQLANDLRRQSDV